MTTGPQTPEDTGKIDSKPEDAYMEEEEVYFQSDTAPEVYRTRHGRVESDVAAVGHVYPAVVTAHFPDEASADRALQEIHRLNLERHQAIQVFGKREDEKEDPGLKPGEVAIIVQLDHPDQGQEILRICEAAGALHSNFYPEQPLGNVVYRK